VDATTEDSDRTLKALSPRPFSDRHIGPSDEQIPELLDALGLASLDALVDEALPPDIRTRAPLDLPAGIGEAEMLAELREIAAANRVFKSFIGLGYYGTHLPPVIQRNVLENPAWYTAYTPYQP
jgi:glycine dehydrogenase